MDTKLQRFRISFERMKPAQKAQLMNNIQLYIVSQLNMPEVLACPMSNQVENHFRTPFSMINVSWWNLLNMWKDSALAKLILNQYS